MGLPRSRACPCPTPGAPGCGEVCEQGRPCRGLQDGRRAGRRVGALKGRLDGSGCVQTAFGENCLIENLLLNPGLRRLVSSRFRSDGIKAAPQRDSKEEQDLSAKLHPHGPGAPGSQGSGVSARYPGGRSAQGDGQAWPQGPCSPFPAQDVSAHVLDRCSLYHPLQTGTPWSGRGGTRPRTAGRPRPSCLTRCPRRRHPPSPGSRGVPPGGWAEGCQVRSVRRRSPASPHPSWAGRRVQAAPQTGSACSGEG